MCGITGIYNPNSPNVQPDDIRNMLSQIQYRGPDEAGIHIGEGIGLGNVRLSIIDLKQGQQPMSTVDEDLWIAGILSTQILMDLFLSKNNPYREKTMRIECPVRYDKNIQNR